MNHSTWSLYKTIFDDQILHFLETFVLFFRLTELVLIDMDRPIEIHINIKGSMRYKRGPDKLLS